MINYFISPFEALKAKSQQAWSGCIEIAEPKDNSVGWHIYLDRGKIQYATSIVGNQERLNYLWQQLKLGSDCPHVTTNQEYKQICQWYEQQQKIELSLEQLILKLTREAINQIFSIEKTEIKFHESSCLWCPITDFTLAKLVNEDLIKSWKKIRKYVRSSFARLEVNKDNKFKFYKLWITQKSKQDFQFNEFANKYNLNSLLVYFSQKTTVYELASRLDLSIFSLVKYFKEFIQAQLIGNKPFIKFESISNQSTQISAQKSKNNISKEVKNRKQDSKPVIVCIDDSKTVHKQVNRILEAINYRVINITDPQLALKSLMKEKPVLILMDINMPTINGYDLCKRLRGSSKFKKIPIIMLTGRDGIIDRMRANLVGSSDYLTKPFEPHSLIEMIQKYVPSATPVKSQSKTKCKL